MIEKGLAYSVKNREMPQTEDVLYFDQIFKGVRKQCALDHRLTASTRAERILYQLALTRFSSLEFRKDRYGKTIPVHFMDESSAKALLDLKPEFEDTDGSIPATEGDRDLIVLQNALKATIDEEGIWKKEQTSMNAAKVFS